MISGFIGFFWFGIEASFIFVLQGFLLSLGLLLPGQNFLPKWYPTGLGSTILILVAFGALRAFVYMLKMYFASLTQASFGCEQRLRLLERGLKNANIISTKEIISVFTEITTQSGAAIYNSSLLVNTGLSAFFFFFAGMRLAPVEMIVGVGMLSFLLIPLKITAKRINDYGVGLNREWENVSESLLRGLKNHFLLSIYNQVEEEIQKGSNSLNNYTRHFIKYSLAGGLLSAFPLFYGISVLSLITFISVKYIHTDSIKLISFFYVFIRLAQAASEASGTFGSLKLSMPGLISLYQWSDRFNAISEDRREKLVIQDKEIVIEVVNLSFGFDNSKPLFENLNFNIKRSEILLIKGESGVGKSTLLSLVLGQRIPTVGEIKINSYSSKEYRLELHKVMAYVGPEPYLIQGTLRQNLIYGLDDGEKITDAEIYTALEKLELKSFVLDLPLKLNEPVYEIPQLSTGQRQRLAFSRALLRKPSLLILDEATANLDSATEKRIIENLSDLFKNCTCIIVTHKDSFDKISTNSLNLNYSK